MTWQRGAVTLVFDDGYQHVYDNVVPILNRYNIKAVFALPLETKQLSTEQPAPLMPWPKWLHLREQGHEIAAHGIMHQDLTKISTSELMNELILPAEKLSATTLVYPGGAVNDRVATAAKKHYLAARSTKHGFESIRPSNLMQLKTYNFTRNNFSTAKANLLVLFAYLTNNWLIETFHIIDNQETEAVHAVNLSEFERHVRFLSKLSIRTETICEMVAP